VEIFQLTDPRGFNLLLLASETGQVDVAINLYKLGLDTEVIGKNIKAQDLALQNGHYELILAMYKADMPLPASIDVKNCPDDFKIFAQKIKELSQSIAKDNLEKVKEIFSQLPKTSYCYNLANESALKVATKKRAFKSYDFFLAEGLRFAPHEPPEEYYEDLKLEDKQLVRQIHEKYTQEMQEQHINVLLSKSFLSHDVPDSKEKLKFVQRAYEALSANVLIKIILMVIAASKDFKIIFDFNREAVNVADPTTTSGTQGIFYLSGKIYIGAKQLLNEATLHETLAVMAHEFCHFAMKLVYGNNAKPYKLDDDAAMEEFEEISDKCLEHWESESVIGSVYEHYPDEMCHAELIVRVVHLMALYRNQPKKLEAVRNTFGCLFDFYENKIVPEMKEALPEIQGRSEREINEKIMEKDRKISKFRAMSVIIAVLSVILIIFGIFVTRSIFYKPVYHFDGLSSEDQVRVENASINYKNVEIQFQDLFPKNSTIYQNLTSDHISQMLKGYQLNFDDPHLSYLNDQIRHSWEYLAGKLRDKFLDSNFTFQNQNLQFLELHEKVPKAFNFLTSEQIVDVLDGTELIVGRMVQNQSNFYIERSFLDEITLITYWMYRRHTEESQTDVKILADTYKSEDQFRDFYKNLLSQNVSFYEQEINKNRLNFQFKNAYDKKFFEIFGFLFPFKTFHDNFEKIIKKTENSKMFILSGEAGTGKTTTFEELTVRIKEKFPSRWVSYIDFKDFTRFYSKNGSLDVENLLIDILDLSSKSEFEKRIFEELFDSGDVILLWNGFDEISPTYSDFVLELLDNIHENSKNIQFVCTRPFYRNRFKYELDIIRYTLVPFDKNSQQEFLNKLFINSQIDPENIQTYVDKVYKIVNYLHGNETQTDVLYLKPNDDFNTPLMLAMIGELIANDIEIYKSENLWEIYEKFIERKIDIWEEKSDFAREFLKKIFTLTNRKFEMMKLYQNFAIQSEMKYFLICNPPHCDFLFRKLKVISQTVPKELTGDEISRMGILYINGLKNFKFAHKTFTEFFIAQFFIENIYNVDDIDSDDAVHVIQFFIDVVKRYGSDQKIIIKFIKSFLETKNVKNNEKFNSKISEVFREKFRFFMFDSIGTADQKIFEFLFNFFKKDHKLLVDLLHVDDSQTLYTASFNPAYLGNGYKEFNSTALKELGKSQLSEDEFEKFLNGRDQKGVILFSLYLSYKTDVKWDRNRTIFHDNYDLDENILQNNDKLQVLELISENLTKNEVNELFLSQNCPIVWTEYEFIKNETFWEIVNQVNFTQHEKNILMSNLYSKISTLDDVMDLVLILTAKSEEFLSKLEIFDIFLHQNILHRAVFFKNGRIFSHWFEFLVGHTNETLKEILLSEIEGPCLTQLDLSIMSPSKTCFYFPAFNLIQILFVHSKNVNFTIGIFENYFNITERQAVILKSHDFLVQFFIWNDFKNSEIFTDYLIDLFKGNEYTLKEYIFTKIKPTNLNIFEYSVNDYYFGNLKKLAIYSGFAQNDSEWDKMVKK